MSKPVPGPLHSPRRPTLALPPGATDCHCHVFGPSARFPFVQGRGYTPPDAPLEDYLRLLERLGLERTVIVQPSVYGNDHSATEDAIRRLGARARGIAVVPPAVDGTELARLDAAGFRGTRLNLLNSGGGVPLEALETVAAKVAPLGWHVQIYAAPDLLADALPRLLALPTPVVIDHLGQIDPAAGLEQPGFRAMLRLIESGRGWVKLCAYRSDLEGAPFHRAAPFVRALEAAAPERLVWGTDWPHPNLPERAPGVPGLMPDDGDLVDALGVWFEDAAARERILVANPARLYGFDVRP
jgi:predicted TIM-barrel fold metal-dependent hydrolase